MASSSQRCVDLVSRHDLSSTRTPCGAFSNMTFTQCEAHRVGSTPCRWHTTLDGVPNVCKRGEHAECSFSGTSISMLLQSFGLRAPDESSSRAVLGGMSFEEASALLQFLLAPLEHNRTKVYVEWGSGGSTELVSWLHFTQQLPPGGVRAYSIESSAAWMSLMRSRTPIIRQAESAGALRFVHGDIGPTARLGYPVNWKGSDDDARRARQLVSLDKLGEDRIDLVLDDGRFRVACALEALPYVRRAGGVLLLHDALFRAHRSSPARVRQYDALTEGGFYRRVRMNDTLAVLTPARAGTYEQAEYDRLMHRALRSPT
jgi:hypothetical protein